VKLQILRVISKYGGFARAETGNASKVIGKNEQWEVIEVGMIVYNLKSFQSDGAHFA
jgi:hypothetical protein